MTRKPDDALPGEKKDMTRRQMLTRLGLAAAAVYAAPVLLQLSEARASSFSGASHSAPSGGRRRRVRSFNRASSFSGGRRRRRAYGTHSQPRRRVRVASSFSR